MNRGPNHAASLSIEAGGLENQSFATGLQPLPEPTQARQDWNTSDVTQIPYLFENDFVLDFDDSGLFAMDLDWNALIEPVIFPSIPYEAGGVPSTSGERSQDISRAPFISRAILGHEAFKRSPWMWQADSYDSAVAEETPQLSEDQEQLLLPRFILDRISMVSMPTSPALGNSARDSILLLVQRNSGPSTIVQSFPSAKTLNFLLMNFVSREKNERCPFIHMPSLAPDKCRTELLTAMIGAGAITVGINQIWKLGLAFQERTRMALFRALDSDNSLARTLDVVQASLLWIETGLWSGSSRKMEVADSAANNVPTVGLIWPYSSVPGWN